MSEDVIGRFMNFNYFMDSRRNRFMKTEAERKRFDKAWVNARKKMLKLAK